MKRLVDIKEVQQHLFEILVAFADFCEEQHLTYFLAYGTLLGAIRHKGFIPWDDDVDVIVPREDYERIHEFARSGKMIGKYKFEFYDTEEKYLYPFCKLVDTSTILKERLSNPWPMGLYIDVFPLDRVPAVDMQGNKIIKKMNFHSILLNSTIWKACGNEPSCIRFLYSIGTLIPKLFNRQIRRISPRKIDELAQFWNCVDNSNFVSQLDWTSGLKRRVYVASDIFPLKELSFNEKLFKVPNNCDSLLKQWYGDYMQLPPEKNRIPHIAEAYLVE